MTNLPFNGIFKCTCVYRKKGSWAAGFHTGIDLVGNNTNVYSVSDGKVIMAKSYGAYGNAVKIKDENGKIFLYAHLKSIAVKVGQTVNRATKIGVMGNTGNSTGPHLHIEMRTSADKYGVVEDIAAYMGIPNALGTYDSVNYPINNEKKYNNGDIIEIDTPFAFTGAMQNNKYMHDTEVEQKWVSLDTHQEVKDNRLIARATFLFEEGENAGVQVFNDQFKIDKKYIRKKL